MYITKTEGPSLPLKRAKAARPALKSDSSFEETVITLLSDAVELTNPNDERQTMDRRSEERTEGDLPHDAQEALPESADSALVKQILSVSA